MVIRTDQIERTVDSLTGKLVDKTLFKIIEPEQGLEIDGKPFPFQSSTQLYPEWNVGALTYVPADVAMEVQQALLALNKHATIGSDILTCYTQHNCTQNDGTCKDDCNSQVLDIQNLILPPDASVELALVANEAKRDGKYVGFESSLSYMELRNMQTDTGFIRRDDESGIYKCIRSSRIYDAIVCPPGHFKQNEDAVENGCKECGSEYQCLCRPCVKAFEVDVFPVIEVSRSEKRPCEKVRYVIVFFSTS